MREIATWGGADGVKLLESRALSDDAAACIAEVVDHSKTVGQDILDRQVRVKLHDKLAALTTLAKHLGLLREPEEPKDRPLFPRGFFAALITGDRVGFSSTWWAVGTLPNGRSREPRRPAMTPSS
jgi:hypothetical protein